MADTQGPFSPKALLTEGSFALAVASRSSVVELVAPQGLAAAHQTLLVPAAEGDRWEQAEAQPLVASWALAPAQVEELSGLEHSMLPPALVDRACVLGRQTETSRVALELVRVPEAASPVVPLPVAVER